MIPIPLSDAEILQSKTGQTDWHELVSKCRYDTQPNELIEDDFVSTPTTAPGRPRTFLTQPELKTAPFSCELIVYNNQLYEGLLKPASRFLRCGAGVKVILDDYEKQPSAAEGFNWKFTLDSSHPDYDKLSSEQKVDFVDRSTIDIYDYDWIVIVEDSMQTTGENNRSVDRFIAKYPDFDAARLSVCSSSIEESWLDLILSARFGESILIDLSELRPHGVRNNNGLMASGPIGLGKHESNRENCSFLSIYQKLAEYLETPQLENLLILSGTLNDTLRRGGFKRGIVTSAMDWRNKAFEEYLNVPLVNLPGGHKKGARISPEICDRQSLVDLVVEKRNSESLFLAKIHKGFYDNVCMGLGIANLGTCLIWRFNIGAVGQMSDIPAWMNRVAEQLMLLHLNWRSELPHIAKIVARQQLDLQVGLDIMGMANFLARYNISYKTFLEALNNFNQYSGRYTDLKPSDDLLSDPADLLVYWLAKGYRQSTTTCDRICELYNTPKMLRIHTPCEPAQSHSYETKDVDGYHTCRAIFPPAGKATRKGVRVRRVSNHQKNIVANHGFVETAVDIGPKLHEQVCAAFTKFVEINGRSHGYMSFDDWQPMTPERLIDWIKNSSLQSMYYNESRNFDQSYLTKAAPSLCSLNPSDRLGSECTVCAE